MTFILFIFMIGLLVAFHELGHMLVAKLFNVYVKEYAIGFGPKIFSYQGKETLYTLRLIPLGGFTAMVESDSDLNDVIIAEDQTEKVEDSKDKPVISKDRTFFAASPFKRICILLAGPLFNILLACLISISIFEISPYKAVYPKAIIDSVNQNSPAMIAGLQANDEIVEVKYSNGDIVKIESTYDLLINSSMHKGDIVISVIRDNKLLSFNVSPQFDQDRQQYMIGITFKGEVKSEKMSFLEAAVEGVISVKDNVLLTIKSVGLLITGAIGLESVSGTVGMYSITQQAVSYGVLSYLSLIATISVSLAVMNLIPIPVLDGGKVVLTVIEKIIGHRISEKVETIILYIGMLLILGLFVIITISDISKLIN